MIRAQDRKRENITEMSIDGGQDCSVGKKLEKSRRNFGEWYVNCLRSTDP